MSGATPIPASNSASPSRLLSDYSQSGAASARASSSSGASFAPSASGSRATWDPLDAGEDVGNRARPVHVVLEESRSFTAMRVAKSLGVTALYAFCGYRSGSVRSSDLIMSIGILTFLSLALENSGLLKAGAQPVEFEPEDAKRVKFSDVHGVDEAKAVSLPWPVHNPVNLTRRRPAAGIGGDCRVPQESGKILDPRWQAAKGRIVDRSTWNGKDDASSGSGWGGWCGG